LAPEGADGDEEEDGVEGQRDGDGDVEEVPGPYSQHFTYSITNEWARLARVLHFIQLERLARAKNSSFLGHYEEMKCCENDIRGCIHNTSLTSFYYKNGPD
jgi:hypothetical protein